MWLWGNAYGIWIYKAGPQVSIHIEKDHRGQTLIHGVGVDQWVPRAFMHHYQINT